ncbi:hypothetical protein F5Y19DRAFT_481020 [Xylariaceae sp. FL1651]|nr:hypothetical protein F5Y19DRAFT_481020 [Xylariaceae sp. FL1651]
MSATLVLGSINDSHRSSYHGVTEQHNTILSGRLPAVTDSIYSYLTWSTLWFSLLCVFIIFNNKTMPFMWHMRILNAFRFVLRSQRPKVPIRPSHLFQPIITSSTAQLMEIDFNMHKSNSSYFADLDIARTHLVCTLFAKGIDHMRGGSGAYTGSNKPIFGLALGAVSCTFKKEVKPYEEYEMWSKILTWDEKWIYIVTHFVRKNAAKPRNYSLYPEQSPTPSRRNSQDTDMDGSEVNGNFSTDRESASKATNEKSGNHIFATALSKCVFKSGRKTVSPELLMEISGLLPTNNKADEKHGKLNDELEAIMAQRQKGMQMAQLFDTKNQQGLESEFEGHDCEALGRHTDGAGIAGVVSTLMQLGRLKKSQLL